MALPELSPLKEVVTEMEGVTEMEAEGDLLPEGDTDWEALAVEEYCQWQHAVEAVRSMLVKVSNGTCS